jgi:hypothetical protein
MQASDWILSILQQFIDRTIYNLGKFRDRDRLLLIFEIVLVKLAKYRLANVLLK